jgi:hypothetical protein
MPAGGGHQHLAVGLLRPVNGLTKASSSVMNVETF